MTNTPPISVAYIVKGFLEAPEGRAALEEHALAQGEIGVFRQLIAYAGLTERVWTEACSINGWPGVWVYDIVEPFGALIARLAVSGEWPDGETLLKHLRDEVESNEPTATHITPAKDSL